jgi:site-specific recombinase XerC
MTLFATWCAERGLRALPAHADVLRLYLAWLAATGRPWSTIKVSHMAIAAVHRALGYKAPDPVRLRAALEELQLLCAPRATRRAPIRLTTLRTIVAACSRDALAVRDRAVLLVAHFGRLSAQGIASLDRDDVERVAHGYLLSKPGPDAESSRRGRAELPTQTDPELCPVRALDQWLEAYGRAANARGACGPLFVAIRGGRGYPLVIGTRISVRSVQRLLHNRATQAGIDAATVSVQGLRAAAVGIGQLSP